MGYESAVIVPEKSGGRKPAGDANAITKQQAQERAGASPPVRCVKVIRCEPAGLRPSALALTLVFPSRKPASRFAFNPIRSGNRIAGSPRIGTGLPTTIVL